MNVHLQMNGCAKYGLHTLEGHSAMTRRSVRAAARTDPEHTVLSETPAPQGHTACDPVAVKRPQQVNPQTERGFTAIRVWEED